MAAIKASLSIGLRCNDLQGPPGIADFIAFWEKSALLAATGAIVCQQHRTSVEKSSRNMRGILRIQSP